MNKIRPRRKSRARQDGVAGREDAGLAQSESAHAAGAGDGEVRDRVNGWSYRQVGV